MVVQSKNYVVLVKGVPRFAMPDNAFYVINWLLDILYDKPVRYRCHPYLIMHRAHSIIQAWDKKTSFKS